MGAVRATEVTEGKTAKSRKGNFFYKSLDVVMEIAKQTNSAEAVFAYFVLSKGKQKKGKASTAGAPKIAEGLGVSPDKARRLLALLESISWGDGPLERVIVTPAVWNENSEEKYDEMTYDKKNRKNWPNKILPPKGENYLFLANSFIDGSDSGRSIAPITKIMDLPKYQQLDTLMLLIKLYHKHQLSDFGGVDPKMLCRTWDVENRIDLEYHGKAYNERYSRFFATATRNKAFTISQDIIDGMFNGDRKRLQTALNNIRELNIIYEVAVVVSDDPLKSDDFEVLYPLRVYDNYLEKREFEAETGMGGLATTASTAIRESGLANELFGTEKVYQFGGNGDLHVFAAPHDKAQVVSVFRLRHLASTEVNGSSYAKEQVRTTRMKEELEQLKFHEERNTDDCELEDGEFIF